MRHSLAWAVAIAAPVLLVVTACGNTPAKPASKSTPLTGTVTEKEYEPEVQGTRKVAITKKVCDYDRKKKKTVCKDVETGKTRSEKYIKTPPCFELDIATKDHGVVEVCDMAAYNDLDVDDFYDSSKYTGEVVK